MPQQELFLKGQGSTLPIIAKKLLQKIGLIQIISVRRQKKGVKAVIKFNKYWLPVILYATLIFYFSSIPGKQIPQLFKGQDIFFHIPEYLILALLLNRAFRIYLARAQYLSRFFWVFVVATLYAATDEFHQSFVPGRTASFFDLGMDSIGILFANIFYR